MAMQARPALAQQTVQPAPVQVATPVQVQQPQPAAQPTGEQKLDTSAQPILQQNNLQVSSIRTVSDEHLPKWVPKRGRLSVVDSSDLAENLGIVPKGSTKAATERISASDELAKQDAARQAQRQTDPNDYASSKRASASQKPAASAASS